MFEFLNRPTQAEPAKAKTRKRTHRMGGRQDVLDYLIAHKGEEITYTQMSEALDMPTGVVSHHVNRLRKMGAVNRRGDKNHYTYTTYRKTTSRRPRSKVAKSVSTQPATEPEKLTRNPYKNRLASDTAVLNFLANHQNELVSQSVISERTKLTQGTVSNAVRRLEKEGVISRSVPVMGEGTRYKVNVVVDYTVDTEAKHLPEKVVPMRQESYEEELIREFLTYWKNRKG